MTEPSQYFKGRTVQEQMDEVIGYVDVRSAEVATTAIAGDVAQVHQDMLDADADAAAAAASAAAAAGTLANAVKKTGEASQSIAGDVAVAGNLSGGTVTVPAPVNNTDAASKKYVDDQDALDAKLTGATFTGVLKATGQESWNVNTPTDNVATVETLNEYGPMMRLANNQQYTGDKTRLKDKSTPNTVMKIIDYDGTTQENIIFDGTLDNLNNWLQIDSVSYENDGRGYFAKSMKIKTASHYATVNIRLWLTDDGDITIGIFNNITNTWKTVVLS